MLISLFPTPFGHFQFLGSAGQIPKLILTLCPKLYYCAISIQRNVIIEDIVLLAIGESVEILHKSNIFSSGTTNSPN